MSTLFFGFRQSFFLCFRPYDINVAYHQQFVNINVGYFLLFLKIFVENHLHLYSICWLFVTFFKFQRIFVDKDKMEGMTITEMAEKLKIQRKTIEMRILRGGYKPLTKDAVYAVEVFEAIKKSRGKGRPKKKPETEPPEGE
jgi:hypothetical protein